MKYSSFEEMPVWLESMGISVAIFELTINLPKCKDYSLINQIRRSATTIAANLAEGFGRSTKLDKARYYVIARGSAYETINHLIYGNKVGYFEFEKVENLKIDLRKSIHDLNKIVNYLLTTSQSQPST